MRRTMLVLLLVALTIPTWAQNAEPTPVDTQIQSVALFKNGLGYFVRAGELPGAPAQVEVGPLPAAVHGTLWLGWGDGVQFANLRSREVVATDTRDALSIDELIRANVGKRVRVTLPDDEEDITGTILSYSQPEESPPVNPYLSIIPPRPEGQGVILISTRSGLGDAGTLALAPNQIQHIIFLEDPATEVPVDAKHVGITGQLENAPGNSALSVSYLAKGMTWAPSYLVDISERPGADERAMLTAKAVIINEIEDLDGATVDLVTGFPYLEFSEIISPLAKKQDLAGFLSALYTGASGQMRRESGARAQVMLNAPMMEYDALTSRFPEYGAPAQGTETEDLFFYPVENVTLERGQTGYYPLFSQRIPYEHVYTWEIADYIDDYERYQQPDDERREIVWHSLRLENETGMPWTTAPAQTVKDGRILGQAMLHYTPKGAETLLKITQALGIQADEAEIETARQPNAQTFHGSRYDRVTVQGTLKMRSHLDEEVTVEVTKMLTGEVRETSPEADVVKLEAGRQRVNPRSRLTWELPLPAGETVEMTYVYEVYVRN